MNNKIVLMFILLLIIVAICVGTKPRKRPRIQNKNYLYEGTIEIPYLSERTIKHFRRHRKEWPLMLNYMVQCVPYFNLSKYATMDEFLDSELHDESSLVKQLMDKCMRDLKTMQAEWLCNHALSLCGFH